MPGPAPQERKHGRGTNTAGDWREVDDVPYAEAPPLPTLPSRRKWHPIVDAWWTSTSTMPHCALWGPPDWQKAFELAYEKQRYYTSGEDDRTTAQLTEIRRREDELGIGQHALQKLKIRYKQKVEPGRGQPADGAAQAVVDDGSRVTPAGKVVSLTDRRAAITGQSAAV